jgi:hypothetical protein
MKRFGTVKKQIEKMLLNSPVQSDPLHAKLVLKWVLKLKPDADEALKIAALAHDIDRAVTKIVDPPTGNLLRYMRLKKEHSLRSAQIIGEILEKNQYPVSVIEKVRHLVENHEFGGDSESELLKDADSLAYFEYNIPFYLRNHGKKNTIGKIRFMYQRMSDDARKSVGKMRFKGEVKKLFEEARPELWGVV